MKVVAIIECWPPVRLFGGRMAECAAGALTFPK